MVNRGCCCFGLFAAVLSLALSATAQAQEPGPAGPGGTYRAEFRGREAPGWMLQPGWEVAPLPGGHWALHGRGHAWARCQAGQWRDSRLHLRVRLVRGTLHVNYRVAGPARYFVGLSAAGQYLSKQTNPETFFNGLARGNRRMAAETWHTVEISGQGGRLEVSVDGQSVMEYLDRSPLREGGIAFETLDDSGAWVDDITVQAAGAQAAPQPKAPGAQPATAEPHVVQRRAPAVKRSIAEPHVVRPDSPAVRRRIAEVARLIPSSPRPGHLARKVLDGVLARADPELEWVRTGGPPGGLGYDIRMSPNDLNLMYVTDAWAGVFISHDGGHNWAPSSAGITTPAGLTGDGIPVFSLTIDPHNPNIIWAGTQRRLGIFRSADAGATWTEMDAGIEPQNGITFRGFTVDPRSSDIVYAAAELDSSTWVKNPPRLGKAFDMTRGAVYRTTDSGRHWARLWDGDSLARYIWIDPRNPDTIYVSTGIFDREAANSDPDTNSPGGLGIIKSTDGGRSWKPINSGLGNLHVGSLFMHPRNPDILLAGVGSNVYLEGSGVYLSTNGGASWTRVLETEGDIPFAFTAVEFAPSDPDIAYAGSYEAIYRSEDGGHHWQRTTGQDSGWGTTGMRAGFPIDFQVHPTNPNVVYANNYGGGNFLSQDGGRTWQDASRGYTGAQIRGIAISGGNPGRAAVSGRSGLFVTRDAGQTWQGRSFPLRIVHDGDAVAIDPHNPNHLLASGYFQGALYESTNDGLDWQVACELGEVDVSWRSFAFAPSDPRTVYAGSAGYHFVGLFDAAKPGKGIFVSHDGGSHWTPANDGLSQDAHVATLAVSPQDPATVYAATTNHGLLRTTDGGQHWVAVGPKPPAKPMALSVAIDPANPQVVYCGLATGGVYRSPDGGTSWQPRVAGLIPQASISEIVVDPHDSAKVYVADVASGVYRSDRAGAAWLPICRGLSLREVNALAISSDGGTLYAGTEGQGVFRLAVAGK